jgi:predicted RNA-binding Zn ribbon-like protein
MDTDETTLLALLNSSPIVDGVARDELGDARSARAWLDTHGIAAPAAEREVLRAGRTALQAVVRGEQPPSSLAPLLGGACYRPVMTDDGVTWTLELTGGRAVVARAVLTWEALRAAGPGRLRACANDECALFLLDRSKSNNARWCSMAVCGNKMKARRYYQRTRHADAR